MGIIDFDDDDEYDLPSKMQQRVKDNLESFIKKADSQHGPLGTGSPNKILDSLRIGNAAYRVLYVEAREQIVGERIRVSESRVSAQRWARQVSSLAVGTLFGGFVYTLLDSPIFASLVGIFSGAQTYPILAREDEEQEYFSQRYLHEVVDVIKRHYFHKIVDGRSR